MSSPPAARAAHRPPRTRRTGPATAATPSCSGPLHHAAEEALRAQDHDHQEDDEDDRVLQLRRQDQGRELLPQPDRHAAPEPAKPAAAPAEPDPRNQTANLFTPPQGG